MAFIAENLPDSHNILAQWMCMEVPILLANKDLASYQMYKLRDQSG